MDELPKAGIASQFKDFYEVDGRLLAVFKAGDPVTQATREVEALNRIKAAGLATPNAELVDVTRGGIAIKGILMDNVPGVFVDLAKIESSKVVNTMLLAAAIGTESLGVPKLDTSEAGLMKMLAAQRALEAKAAEIPANPVCQALAGNLEAIQQAFKEAGPAINDLQVIVTPEGGAVVIDPQWAGPLQEVENPEEKRFITATYRKLEAGIQALKTGVLQPALGVGGPARGNNSNDLRKQMFKGGVNPPF